MLRPRFVGVTTSTENWRLGVLFLYDAGMPKKVKTSIFIGSEQLAKLKAISRNTMIPMSALMRRALDLVIAEFGKSGKK